MKIPEFRYHPDPFGTDVIVGADENCECCGERRSLFYTGPFYSRQQVEKLCLWCVSDGNAARKFEGEFVDEAVFEGCEIDGAIVDEVSHRTPSYRAWQQEEWLVHCDDACEFLGYPNAEELRSVSDQTKNDWMIRHDLTLPDWDITVEGFEKQVAGFYKFGCRRCAWVMYASDWS